LVFEHASDVPTDPDWLAFVLLYKLTA
jgi:hypothetical protein